MAVAQRHELHPVPMALVIRPRPFPVCPIVGATTLEQMQIILDDNDVVLSDEVVGEIDAAYKANPLPY